MRLRDTSAGALVCMLGIGGVARAGSTGCVVHGDDVTVTIHVAPPGVPTLDIDVDDLPADATLSPRGAPARVAVAGYLELEGTAKELPVYVALATVSEDGIVRLAPGATLDSAASAGDQAIGDFSSRGLHLLGASVPCAALQLGEPASTGTASLPERDGTTWMARGRAMALLPAPGAAGGVRVTADKGIDLRFERVSTSGDWTQVAISLGAAGAVGWVPTVALERAPADFRRGDTFGFGTGCGSAVDYAFGSDIYYGPATVVPGTMASLDRGRGSFARVRSADSVTVRHRKGDDWAMITEVPGMRRNDCDPLAVWVPASAVRYPPASAPVHPGRF